MDLEKGEDFLEEAWGLDFEEALPPGLILVGEEGDCRGAGISLVEQPVHRWRGRISGLLTLLTERQQLPLEQHPLPRK